MNFKEFKQGVLKIPRAELMDQIDRLKFELRKLKFRAEELTDPKKKEKNLQEQKQVKV